MVECSPATRAIRVRFPADASFLIIPIEFGNTFFLISKISLMIVIFRKMSKKCVLLHSYQVLGSIVVSISACHVEDPGSIPGRGGLTFCNNFNQISIK